MKVHTVSAPAHGRTSRQRSVRCRSSSVSLENAVCHAVDLFFGFKYRDPRSAALWCDTQRVWLGSETFLYWALWDADIDIPWVVATALDAPEDAGELREAVRAELSAYWEDRTASLPRTGQPRWLPLP